MAFDLDKFLENDKLKIGDREFKSRLIVGSGKYKDFDECVKKNQDNLILKHIVQSLNVKLKVLKKC